MARGEGSGAIDDGHIVAGSSVAICVTVCFFCVGIPTILTGIAFMYSFRDTWPVGFGVGVACVTIALLLLLGGVITVILICTNCCKMSNNQVEDVDYRNHNGPFVVSREMGMQQFHYSRPPFEPQKPPAYSDHMRPQSPPPSYDSNMPGTSTSYTNPPNMPERSIAQNNGHQSSVDGGW